MTHCVCFVGHKIELRSFAISCDGIKNVPKIKINMSLYDIKRLRLVQTYAGSSLIIPTASSFSDPSLALLSPHLI